MSVMKKERYMPDNNLSLNTTNENEYNFEDGKLNDTMASFYLENYSKNPKNEHLDISNISFYNNDFIKPGHSKKILKNDSISDEDFLIKFKEYFII